MSQRKSNPVKIAILGGDLLVGRSLAVALRGIGYDACFLHASLSGEPADLPEEVEASNLRPQNEHRAPQVLPWSRKGHSGEGGGAGVGACCGLRRFTKRAKR